MDFEFKHIDDFEFIIPRDKWRMGNDFKALVDKFFPDDNDLIIALIEMNSLSDINKIGERYLFSEHLDVEGQEFLKNYEDIVNQVYRDMNLNVTCYVDWYKRQSYILKRSQRTTEFNFPRSRIDWEQAAGTQKKIEKRDDTEFAKLKPDILKETDITDYLSHYGKLLHEKLGFNQYPHYCVIIRPISVSEKGRETVPLGNIFLHFATMTEKTDEFYLHFINEFLLVWFKKNGVKIIREIKFEAIEGHKGRKATKTYLPNFSHLKNGQARQRLSKLLKPKYHLTLEQCYDDYFNSDTKINSFIEKCMNMAKIAIVKFTVIQECLNKHNTSSNKEILIPPLKLNEISNCAPDTVKFWDKYGQHNLIEHGSECFELVLLKRELFKIGFLCFEIERNVLVNLIVKGEFNTATNSAASDHNFIWTELFLPWQSKQAIRPEHLPNFRQAIENSFSVLEKDLFDKYQVLKNGSS
ncbi:hypothetical protein ACFLR1_03170 [Bacteroidota bacterium]